MIAKQFDLMSKLLELHDENKFKIRSYSGMVQRIRMASASFNTLEESEMISMPGIGKGSAAKIKELIDTGKMTELEELKANTPSGVLDILKIKGLGAKKIRMIWKDLGINSLGELEYACHENRLVSLKGFGLKTQQNVLDQIAFFKQHAGSILLSDALIIVDALMDDLGEAFPKEKFVISGQVRRKMDLISRLDILGSLDSESLKIYLTKKDVIEIREGQLFYQGVSFHYHELLNENTFGSQLFESTGPEKFVKRAKIQASKEESVIFDSNNWPYIPAECRDLWDETFNQLLEEDKLLKDTQIKGVIHCHSQWSDGSATLKDMAEASRELGYEYLLMSDHSVSAFYANGLSEERILAQWEEIDHLNEKLNGFKIFKGIESDILPNGDLDYPQEILDQFDVVIASIHSGLQMDQEKAHSRLIRAIENPACRILGHMTGRLLLGRPGYSVDHHYIIDACAANGVAIEINSNPHRLDIDWRYLPYAISKGVEISISPDAHHISGLKDIQYGVWMARKGFVPTHLVINTKGLNAFNDWINKS